MLAGGDFCKIVVIYGFTTILQKYNRLPLYGIRNFAHAKEAPGGEKSPPGDAPRRATFSPFSSFSSFSQIRQARSILRHANTRHKHKPEGRSVCVLCARLPDTFKRKTLVYVYLYVCVYLSSYR